MLTQKRMKGLASLILSLILLSTYLPALAEDGTATTYATVVSAMEAQDAIDADLLAEAALGYTFEAPLCVVNPYGTVPLCAVIIFDTEEETAVSMTVKGHAEEDDVTAEFPAATRHILPVVGLYANEENTVVLTLPDGSTSTVLVQTEGIADEALLTGEVTVPAGADYDYGKLTFVSVGNTQCIAAYDSKGDLRYYALFPSKRTTPFRQLENGHYLVACDNTAEETEALGGIMEVDLCGRIYNQYKLPGGFHHGLIELPNGNFLAASSQDDLTVLMDRVVEIDRETGDIVWDFDLSDIMDSTDGSGTLYKEKDWSHMNSLSYDAETDSVLMSNRAIDAVISIDYETKSINWILGTSEGWANTDLSLFFTPAEDQEDFEWQFAQHNASFIDSTHVLLFDNGTNRYKTTTAEEDQNTEHYSRAVLYAIDTDTMTVTQEWSYGKNLGLSWYSSHFCGAFYDTDADAYWICSGTTSYDTATETYVSAATDAEDSSTVITLAKIDMVRDDTLLYELVVTGAGYRAERYDPYTYAAMLDLETPGATYTYTAE